MRVLFIYPKTSCGNPWIPLGTAYTAACLRKHGIDVRIIDNNLHKWNKEGLSTLMKEYQPDIIGMGGMTVQLNDALKIGNLVKCVEKIRFMVESYLTNSSKYGR